MMNCCLKVHCYLQFSHSYSMFILHIFLQYIYFIYFFTLWLSRVMFCLKLCISILGLYMCLPNCDSIHAPEDRFSSVNCLSVVWPDWAPWVHNPTYYSLPQRLVTWWRFKFQNGLSSDFVSLQSSPTNLSILRCAKAELFCTLRHLNKHALIYQTFLLQVFEYKSRRFLKRQFLLSFHKSEQKTLKMCIFSVM